MRLRSLTFALLAAAGLFVARIPVMLHREIDPDEFEHAHAAWCVFKGMLPYKDFFEHHTPWYYYALRPFFNWFDVDTSFDSARHFLLLGRGLSFVLTVLSILLVVGIGRRWEGRRVGLLAGLLLLSQPIFFQKTVELRPDVPALLFFVASLWCLLRGLQRSADATAPALRWFVAGGLSLGAAVMCTQKMLFVFPGALAGLGIWALSAGKAGARARILSTLAFLLGVCVPGALTWAAFAFHHAGPEFITNNFLLNAKWKHTATNQLFKLLRTSGPVLALSLLGVALSLSRFFRSAPRRYGDFLLICILAGLFLGVVVMPSAHKQYYLIPLPIVCLFAATALFWIVERLRKAARAFVVVAAIGLAAHPILALVEAFRQPTNDAQLAKLRTVFQGTQPTDLVMDGWQGMGVFRPHAFHYFFLHEETRAMLPRPQLDAYLDALESGAIRPRLIVMDKNLAALGPRFVSFVETHYASRDGSFYWARAGF